MDTPCEAMRNSEEKFFILFLLSVFALFSLLALSSDKQAAVAWHAKILEE